MKTVSPADHGAAIHASRALVVPTRALVLVAIAICVVLPHSLQAVTAVLLGGAAAMSLLLLRAGRGITYVGICFVLSALVTVAYILVGMARGAPTTAVLQTLAIYIVSPLLWMTVWRCAIQLTSPEWLLRYILALSAMACASVALFFFLFLTLGPQAVSFFIAESNVSIAEGRAGATMHVYGSMVFLTAATFAAPELIRHVWARIALLTALAAVALTSGRSALILTIPIGLATGTAIRRFQAGPRGRGRARGGGYMIAFAMAVAVLLLLATVFTDLNISGIIESTWDKVLSGGGEARTDQSAALIDGIADTLGLGAGHGIGVALVRNYDYPWRYENVLLASVFRVGVVGAVIYAAVWIITLLIATRRMLERRWTAEDTFVLAGLVAMILASPTNPYLESFIFQWAYTLPLIYFSHRLLQDRAGGQPTQAVR